MIRYRAVILIVCNPPPPRCTPPIPSLLPLPFLCWLDINISQKVATIHLPGNFHVSKALKNDPVSMKEMDKGIQHFFKKNKIVVFVFFFARVIF